MKKALLFLCFLLFVQLLHAQLPISYYDFENNTTRTTYENTVEQSINSGSTSVTASSTLTTVGGASGAGLSYTGGTANGEAISANTWSTAGTDPGTSATTYLQFTVNTSGFAGLSIQFDCNVTNVNIFGIGIIIGPRNAGILYSTDGGVTFHTTSTQSTGTQNAWNHLSFDLSSFTAVNNNSSVIIRVYGYNAQTIIESEPMSIDNLQVSASSTVSNAGTINLLNEAGIYTCTTSGTTGSIFSRQNFTVTGTSTIVNMSQEKFSGSGTSAGNLIVQDTATLNITSAVTIDSAIIAASTPLSTLSISSYGTVNLSANILCKGSVTVSNNGVLNCNTNTLTNYGTFILSSGGTLGIGSSAGISSSGLTGNIQTTTRSFNAGSNYIYDGSSNQITGSGLPSSINNLTIYNTENTISLTNNLTVNNQTTLTSGTLIIGNKTLTLNGAVSRVSGNFDGNENAALVLAGSAAQNISFDANDTLSTLTINKSTGTTATLNSALNIFTGIIFNSANLGTLDLNNNHVTLKSNTTFTAYVGTIYGSLNDATNVTIERYVAAHRAWRLIGAPINSSSAPTINTAWQEGSVVSTPGTIVNPNPGYGTNITGGASSLGFDRNYVNNPSIYGFNNSTIQWGLLANTNSTVITNYPAYMLFVRGSRAVNLDENQYAPADNTVLRMTGKLLTPQTFIASSAGAMAITNPYASTINFTTTIKTNVANTYYLWDPLLTGNNGVGAFVTLTKFGSGYLAAPTPISPIDLNGSIESGAAFFVVFSGVGSLQINESDKTTGSAEVFRPSLFQSNPPKLFRTNLYSVNADSSTTLLDGVMAIYDSSYNNAVDSLDAIKLPNAAENMSIQRNGKQLAIEMRQPIGLTDTIFLKTTQMPQQLYQLEFIANNLNQSRLKAFLIDNYLNNKTAINLADTNKVNFSITADAASALPNRFTIVFDDISLMLPFKFISVNVAYKNNDVALQWKVINETDVSHYEVERSVNGKDFNVTGKVIVSPNLEGGYNQTESIPINGINYYRIKSVANSGKIIYSSTVQASLEDNIQSAEIIYPNPVVDGVMNVHLYQQPDGVYYIKLINQSGQIIFNQTIVHNIDTETEIISLPHNIANNIYQLEIIKPDGSKINSSCLVK